MKKLLLVLLLLGGLVAILVAFVLSGDEGPPRRAVRVARGRVVQQALAVGRIEPRTEVPVTARHGGVLSMRFARLGEKVSADAPLVEVRPVVTDLDMLQAERALLSAREAEENVEEFREGENLLGRAMLLLQGSDNVERTRQNVSRARADAEERLELLREGEAEIDGKRIDFVVRAPVPGHVIELTTELGEPVVPASSYGPGTVLVILADMDRPVFRGTVNEIDVGRLHEGMPATLSVGALSGVDVEGRLVEIALRSRTLNNATVFDVVLEVTPPPELVLRSGYSAVAKVVIAEAEDVLVLPERVVDYRGGSAFVEVRTADGSAEEREIRAGLGDGLQVEVLDGLAEGDEVFERVYE